jgi:hypothetical protein
MGQWEKQPEEESVEAGTASKYGPDLLPHAARERLCSDRILRALCPYLFTATFRDSSEPWII